METELNIDEIKNAFGQMQSKEDLLFLLNRVKPFLYGKGSIPFELKQLTLYANPKLGPKRYNEFVIKKKSGQNRTINAPIEGLKAIQKCLSLILQCVFEPHEAAMGFTKNKSIVHNAEHHLDCNYIYNIDLKDFFTSIDQARVWKCLQLRPFYLSSSNLQFEKAVANNINNGTKKFITEFGESIYYEIKGSSILILRDKKGDWKKYKDRIIDQSFLQNVRRNKQDSNFKKKYTTIIYEDAKRYIQSSKSHKQLPPSRLFLANMIASICCTEMLVERKNESDEWQKVAKNVLPQGAPTSPIISNIVCQRLDYLLTGVAKRFGLKYTRYVDDITFSSKHNVYRPDSDFLKELSRIINEQGFQIKDDKTRLQKRGYRQEVTGLLVNEKVNVHKRYIKRLRMWLYYLERYGQEKAYHMLLQHYNKENVNLNKDLPDFEKVLTGKLNYLKMVKGSENELYLKLRHRFEKIIGVLSKDKKHKKLEDSRSQGESGAVLIESKKAIKKELITRRHTTNDQQQLLPIIHNPNELVSLLKHFSINDSALKYTTHTWDTGRDIGIFKDITDFLYKANEEYSKFSFKLNTLSKNLNAKIFNFLLNENVSKNGWGINRIKFGWSSPEILKACSKNPDLKPEDFILPENYQLQIAGTTIQKFKHVIDIFKNEIEVRDENFALLNLILQKHDYFLISFADPIIVDLENKAFYTDVQWLSKALDLIFEGIKKWPQHPIVEYSISESSNDKVVLNILHRNSFKPGLSINDDKLNLMRGDFSTIRGYLENLCDWSIESRFSEGCYRLNYLVSDPNTQFLEPIENTPGFKHILTFYK